MLQPGGVTADPDKVSAIADFLRPSSITYLRSFMGLVEQLAYLYINAAATPLRPLLKPSNEFILTPDHDAAFKKVKSALISPPVLSV